MKNPIAILAAVLLILVSFLVAPSAEARFLQVDPIGYEDNMNLYSYTANDPVNMVDPSGLYGRGKGWTDEQWKKFDKFQKKAAEKATKRAGKLREKAGKLRGKKDATEKDLAKADGLEANADALDDVANILNDDGSQGFEADLLDSTQWSDKGLGSGAAAAAQVNGQKMLVNGAHPMMMSRHQLTKLGLKMPSNSFTHTLMHEPLHNLGFRDQRLNGQIAYKYGTPMQQGAYKALPGVDPARAFLNPDHIVGWGY